MTDLQLVISAVREAGRIISEYLEPGARDADETITDLIAAASRKSPSVKCAPLVFANSEFTGSRS
jgi:hypothetical protein